MKIPKWMLWCAWLLWSQTVAGGGSVDVHSVWEMISAYPDDGYSACMVTAKTLAEKLAKVDTSPSSAVRRTRLLTPQSDALIYTGKAHQVVTTYKDGATDVTAYRCLPDTVNPRT